MSDPQVTLITGLPMLAAGQAQKELTHNEALVLIDALLFPVAQASAVNTPPSGPTAGQCWLVGSLPSGAWTGHALKLAIWTTAGWRFAPMPLGAVVAVGPEKRWSRRTDAGWLAAPVIAAPAGGAVIDVECRTSLNQLLAGLRDAGIIGNS